MFSSISFSLFFDLLGNNSNTNSNVWYCQCSIFSRNLFDIQSVSGCKISATSSVWIVADFLPDSVSEWLQNFCNTQCMNLCRISATPCVWSWMIAEFLLHPVYECGRRISATSSVWVVAEFLQHPVYESLQNFFYIHCIRGRRISATPSVSAVANFCNIQCKSAYRISTTPSV